MKPLTDALRAPIDSLADGESFIRELVGQGLAYHFDDDPIDCLARNGLLTFPDAMTIGNQVRALNGLDWGAAACPIGFMLHVLAENDAANPDCLLPINWRPPGIAVTPSE